MTRHLRALVFSSVLPFLLILPRGDASPHTVPVRLLVGDIDTSGDASQAKEAPQMEIASIPTTDEEFKKMRALMLNNLPQHHSVVDELLMERRAAAKGTAA
ncbi:hypothetical protein [Candidatus Synechococcus spongiarum]|nr:hypothetical protein [Candidatus Synechococcus spongiarum]